MTWSNSDGLFVKFGQEEATVARGGEFCMPGGNRVTEFLVDWEDMLSATATILGAASDVTAGSQGVLMPADAFIEAIEFVVEEAFTSSGTIGSSTMVMGLVRQDRSTTYDVDGFTTTSFVGSALDTAGERTYLTAGGTGAGALVGTTLANSGYIVVANSAHGSHPYTAGRVRVRVYWHTVVDNVDGS